MLSKFYIDDLVIHDLSSSTVPYSLTKSGGVEGLGEPQFRLSSYDNPGEDGGTVSQDLLGMRRIKLQGIVRGSTSAELFNNRVELQRRCRPTRDSNSLPVAKVFKFVAADGNTYFIEGFIQACLLGIEQNTTSPFMIQVVCPNATIYRDVLTSSGQITRPVTTGSLLFDPTIEFNPTIEFGASTGGVITIVNLGTADTWPVIYLRGPLVNPTIIHVEKSKSMQFNVTIAAGSTVVIDMQQKTVVLNGATNYLTYKTADSSWFSFQPGNNTLRFSTTNTGDTGTMETQHYPAMLGV